MRIVEIREQAVPIRSAIRNAYIDFAKMDVAVVAVVTDVVRDGRRVVGYGFNSNGRYAPIGLLRERFIPRIMEAPPESLLSDDGENVDPHKIWAAMMTGEKPGGHGERSVAVGTIDMAVWDAVAKIEGCRSTGCWRIVTVVAWSTSGSGSTPPGAITSPAKTLPPSRMRCAAIWPWATTTVKMKIGGAPLSEDLKRIEAVLEVVGEGKNLAVDANGRFDLPTAIAYAEALAPYGLRWYEEAGDPLDYALQAQLGNHYDGPMATGENLFSMPDARNLIRYGGMRPDRDVLQFDCALSYGLVEYLRTLEMLEEHGWSARRVVPHGGHQMSLNMAAGLGLGGNESYPGIFQPFGGFADGIAVEDGYVELPQAPGIGFEEKADLYEVMKGVAE